jgi:uncharacterized membrane-anchored protein
MVLNILFLLVVFGLPKKKFNPYIVGGIYGLLKGITYYIVARQIGLALIALLMGAIIGFTTRYLFCRLDRYFMSGETYSDGSSKKKTRFMWEYIPLTALVIIMIVAF